MTAAYIGAGIGLTFIGVCWLVSYGVARIARSEADESERDWPYGDVVQVPNLDTHGPTL